jgi:hypothetical protein
VLARFVVGTGAETGTGTEVKGKSVEVVGRDAPFVRFLRLRAILSRF